jgi:flagella basal body P-ring formation protein FlgA
MQGALVDVVRDGDAVEVRVNGRAAAAGRVGEAIRVRL